MGLQELAPGERSASVFPSPASQVSTEAIGEDWAPSEGDAMEVCSEQAEAHPEPPRERRAYGHRMPSPSVLVKVPQEDLKRQEEKQAAVMAGALPGFSSRPAALLVLGPVIDQLTEARGHGGSRGGPAYSGTGPPVW